LKRVSIACVLGLGVFLLAACHEDPTQVATTPAGTANLPSGSGAATLAWEAPTTTTVGAPLMNLAGYRIYYGTDENSLEGMIQLTGTGLQTYTIDDLGPGTWYFGVRAVTSAGVESPLSEIVSKTIG
jgi:hypothetical protein